MTERRTLKDIVDTVNAIGTPDEIAEFMREQGIKGRRLHPRRCVMARYITEEMHGEPEYVSAFPYAGFRVKHQDGGGEEDYNDTPFPLGNFMHNFDDGKYPFLIEGITTE